MQARAAAFVREQVIPAIDGWERDGRYPRAVGGRLGPDRALLPGGGRRSGALLPRRDGGLRGARPRRRRPGLLALDAQRGGGGRGRPCGARRALGAGLAAGEALGGFSLTEPHAGSDATAITTLAEPDGERLARDRTQGVGVAGRRGRPVPGRVQDVSRAGPPRHRDRGRRARPRPACRFPVLYRKACADFLPIGEMELDGAPGDAAGPSRRGHAGGPRSDRRRPLRHRGDRRPAFTPRRSTRRCATPPQRQAFGAPLLDLDPIRFALADVATDLEASRLLYRQAAERLGTPAGPGGRRAREAVLPRRGPAGRHRVQRGARAPTAGCSTTRSRG